MSTEEDNKTTNEEHDKETKPQVEVKSSMEILSELFGSFDAEPPVIVKKEKDDNKKHKKSKKKHKHKDKKHKKRSKKKKKGKDASSGGSSSTSDDDDEGIDLSAILIKTEIDGSRISLTDTLQKIINIKSEGLLNTEIKKEIKPEPENIDEKTKSTLKSPAKDTGSDSCGRNGKSIIKIKDLKHSSIFSTVAHASDEHKTCRKRRKYKQDKYDEEKPSKKVRTSRSRSKEKPTFKSVTKDNDSARSRNRDRSPRHKFDEYYDKYDKYEKHRDSEYKDYRSKSDYKYKDDKNDLRHKLKDDYSRPDDDYNRHKDDGRRHGRDNSFYKDYTEERRSRNRYKEHVRDRNFRNAEFDSPIDKKKLLEIARKNAIQMMKSGNLPGALTLGPQAQEKVIAAIRCGGKTVAELTDFCKTLSKKEELGELSSVSEDSDSDGELKLHHPFLIKDKPLTINIKNSVPLPTKTNQERASELRIQFPVSSGQQHRKTESEWVPVSPKKSEPPLPAPVPAPKPVPPPIALPITSTSAPLLAIEAAPAKNTLLTPSPQLPATVPAAVNAPPGPQVFPLAVPPTEQDLATIVTQRLAAMRKLQENPNDSQAIVEMYNAQKDMNIWAESKQPIGQFTGTTGAQILSQAELSSGYQAWARKDQLQTAAPVSGGMGMHLLQKMGWRPGEGLGKEKSGTLEPLLLEVKLDKKGIVAKEECKRKTAIRIPKQTVKTLQGKHPVSLLGEFASKRKLGAPEYILDFECGPDHMKNFLFKVRLNGVEYKPNVASGNKKEAKALAATLCLQSLGLLVP